MGIIRHSIITPIISPVVNIGVDKMAQQFMSIATRPMISGISSGDDYSDNKIKIYNAKDDALIDARDEEDIPKLVSINKLEENREFNRMLRSIQDYQQEGKQVPIFDVSNKTTIIPKANTGFSFVNSAHANPMGSVATTMGGGIVGQDLALAIAFRTSTFLSKAPIAMGIVGTGMGLHNAAQFEAQHPLLSSEFNDIMTNPYISQKDKDSYWQKATNDPLFRSNNSSINRPILQTNTSSLLNDIRMDIDPNAGKPILETFPVHYQPKSILFTPDDRQTVGNLGGHELDRLLEKRRHEDTLSVSVADVSANEDDQDSGICKVQSIYSENAPNAKKISAKQREQMQNIPLYGMNPGNITEDNKGVLFVDTELPGEKVAARECFKNLTGRYPIGVKDDANKDGTIISYRALGKSGQPKVEIHNMLIKVLEKITFK